MHILIAYASATGTTQRIAEHISTRLTSASLSGKPTVKFTTVLHPLCEPALSASSPPGAISNKDIDITTFDVIVLGSAIQDFKWLPQAESFASKLASQPATSESIPIFAFSVGVPYSMPLGMGSRVARHEQKSIGAELRSQVGERLKDHTLFEGNFTKEDLGKGFMGGALRAVWHLGGRYGNHMDLGKVDGWVDGVVVQELGKVK